MVQIFPMSVRIGCNVTGACAGMLYHMAQPIPVPWAQQKVGLILQFVLTGAPQKAPLLVERAGVRRLRSTAGSLGDHGEAELPRFLAMVGLYELDQSDCRGRRSRIAAKEVHEAADDIVSPPPVLYNLYSAKRGLQRSALSIYWLRVCHVCCHWAASRVLGLGGESSLAVGARQWLTGSPLRR